MIEIPANILTLLKSRQQIGENRPTARIVFGGMPGDKNLKDPTDWTDWVTFAGTVANPGIARGWGNMDETSDGKAIVVFVEGTDVKVAFSSTVVGILSQTETFDFGASITLASDYNMASASMAKINNRLCILLVHMRLLAPDYVVSAEFWMDSDGKGLDFAKVADIALDLSSGYAYKDWNMYRRGISLPTLLDNGNIVVGLPCWGWGVPWGIGSVAYYSTDGGLTWNQGAYDVNYADYWQGILDIGGGSFITYRNTNVSANQMAVWTDSGETVTLYGWTDDWASVLASWSVPFMATPFMLGDELWLCSPAADSTNKIFRWVHNGTGVSPNHTNIASAEDWEYIVSLDMMDNYLPPCYFTVTQDALIMQHSSFDEFVQTISGAGTLVQSVPIRPKRVVVSRTKGGASQLSVQFANTNGQYAPDPAGPWQFVMWPNNAVRAEIGYGTYLPQVFRGSIDDVDMDTPPQMITITARDRSKLLLDQMCQWTWDGVTYYDGAWASQDPEGIALTLFTMAGFAEADIVYDVTGITIPEFKFNQQTYADLLQKLAEMAGCEWYCDEDGKGYFKLVTYPEATPAYSFVAGVDIFSLGYRISDAEIYRWVVVTAQGPEDEGGNRETISVRVEWSAADYYGLPAHKTLYVTASDLVQDEAGCLEIANRMLTAMTTKPRQVNFVCVGIPNVQIGDCIQVTEASSTISEIYRVYDFEHQYDAEGSPVFATAIKCYWYAHG